METRASAKYVRVSPQKVRLVTDMIRGKDLLEAQHLLEYSEKAAAGILAKLLASAAANAENNNNLRLEDLYIARAFVDEGPTLPMRYRMRAMGRVGSIHKRTSHITVILEEREPDEGRGRKRRFTMRRPKREKPEEEMELEEEEMELEEEEMESGELEGEEMELEEEEMESGELEGEEMELEEDIEEAETEQAELEAGEEEAAEEAPEETEPESDDDKESGEAEEETDEETKEEPLTDTDEKGEG